MSNTPKVVQMSNGQPIPVSIQPMASYSVAVSGPVASYGAYGGGGGGQYGGITQTTYPAGYSGVTSVGHGSYGYTGSAAVWNPNQRNAQLADIERLENMISALMKQVAILMDKAP